MPSTLTAAATATAKRDILFRVAAKVRRLPSRVACPTHQGLWTPGVRLLRNLSLRAKTLLLVACIGLPFGVLLAEDVLHQIDVYRISQHRLRSLAQVEQMSALVRSASAMQGEALAADLGLRPAALKGLREADQARFDEFIALLQVDSAPLSTQAAVDALQTQRRGMLASLDDASPSGLPGRSGPRLESLAAYVHELGVLRRELARHNGIAAEAPEAVRALDEATSRSLPALRWLVGRTLGIGMPLYESKDRAARALRLGLLAVQAGVMLETTEADLGYSVAEDRLDATLTRACLAALHQHVDRAALLARAAPGAAGATEVAAISGFERAEFLESGRQALEMVENLEAVALAGLRSWAEARDVEMRRHLAIFAGLLAAWALLASYVLACTYRVLAGGLKALCTHLEAIGRGDLSQRPRGHGRDEIGRALNALGTSIGQMAQLFGAVTQGVAAVSQASREVATGNAGMSRRVGEVRAALAGAAERAEACSSALDTSGAQVEQSAELVRSMRADDQRTHEAMAGLREAMARLQVKSREIGQVVGLVEAVAYQTRLLAINASVEAARAGPAGRGFAVVAKEVRALAQRSSQAAQRISGIAGASVDEIDAAGVMAERADEAVRRNEKKTESVDALMHETVALTRGGREASQEVLMIARSVEDTMAGNVRLIDQLADASAGLRSQGDHLKRSVQHFVFA